jgi:hypothetical protein
MIRNKKGTETWQIIALILTVVVIALVIYGIYTDKLTPLFKKVRNMIYSALSLFGYDYSTPLPPVKTAVILGQERNVTFHEGDGTNFECEAAIRGVGSYSVKYDTSKKGYVLWEWLDSGDKWVNVDDKIMTQEQINLRNIYNKLKNTLNKKLILPVKNPDDLDMISVVGRTVLDNDYGLCVDTSKTYSDPKIVKFRYKTYCQGEFFYPLVPDSANSKISVIKVIPSAELLKEEKRLSDLFSSLLNNLGKDGIKLKKIGGNGEEIQGVSGLSYYILYTEEGGYYYGIASQEDYIQNFLKKESGKKWHRYQENPDEKNYEGSYLFDGNPLLTQIKQELVETCENW